MGFLSYARVDFETSGKDISWFRRQLIGEVQLRTGKRFDIFFDQDNIDVGKNWEEQIASALASSLVLITIITQALLESDNCYKEYLMFKKREADLGRNDLIIPIYFVDSYTFNIGTRGDVGSWLADLKSRQYIDWREHRHGSGSSRTVKLVEAVARRVQQVILDLAPNSRGDDALTRQRLTGVPQSTSKTFNDWVEFVYIRLPRTQKMVVRAIYEHKDGQEVALDLLAEEFFGEHGTQHVGNVSELLYRVKDLAYHGLVDIRALGGRRTNVSGRAEVRNALNERGLLSRSEDEGEKPTE
jgi:hypothetical protein